MSARNKFLILLGIIFVIAATYYFLSTDHSRDLVLIGTRAVAKDQVTSLLRPDQKLIDLMRLEESRPVVIATAVSA